MPVGMKWSRPVVSLCVAILSERALAAELHVPRDFATIQGAIDAASAADVVVVSPGTYQETIDLLGKYIQLRSTSGPFATIISAAGLNATAVRCGSVNGPEQSIDGFTITGGVADTEFFGGGGMLIDAGTPTILNCRFIANRAHGSVLDGLGGGLTALTSFPTVINCEFIGNHADQEGGAVAAVRGVLTLINCTIVSNDALELGGATAWDADIYLYNCIVRNNWPDQLQTTCCVTFPFYCNIEDGPAGNGNIDLDAKFVRAASAGADKEWGTVDDDWGDLRLRHDSPCIDTGSDALVPADIAEEIAGLLRFADGNGDDATIVDMGAHERPKPGDANGDGSVNVADLLLIIDLWGACGGSCLADFNDDGQVGVGDLLMAIAQWG